MKRAVRSIAAVFAVFAAVVFAAPSAQAQGVTGSAVTGIIQEEGGGIVPGAQIQLRNPSNGDTFTAESDIDGVYFFDNVPPGGPYVLTAQAEGHQITQREFTTSLGQKLSLDVELKLQAGAVEEIVIQEQVSVLEDSSRTGAQTVVSQRKINGIPLQGRNFTDLVSTTPQASGNSIAGQNNRSNNIQIDGGANNDLFGLAASGTPGGQSNAKPVSLEAIREFVVQIAPFDVRQGSFTGGLVNAITKSGTNTFQGSLFGYFQNKSFAGDRGHDANSAAECTAASDPKACQRSFSDDLLDFNIWQFGGTVGGPIIQDKMHFFVSADIQSRSQAFGNNFQLTGDPTLDMMRAGFTTAEVDRFVAALAARGITNVGTALGTDLENPDRNVFAKVSTNMIPQSRLELSYNLVDAADDNIIRAPTSTTIPGRLRDGYQLSNSGYAQSNTTHTVRAKLTSNFGDGKWSNELLTGFSIIRDERSLPQKVPLILVQAGSVGAADSFLAAGAERFSHQNLLDQDIFQLQDNLSYSLGKHRLTAGTSNEFFAIRNVFFQAAMGVWAFGRRDPDGPTGPMPEISGLEAFEQGLAPSAYQRRIGVPGTGVEPGTAEFNVAQLGFYLQDEWAVMSNLTVTGGVRVDLPFLSAADTNPALVNNQAFPIDTGEVPSGNPLWSPRVGFNWDIDGEANTVVRGGAGIFSGRPAYVWVSNAYSINGMSQLEITCSGATVPTFTADPNAQPSDCGTAPPPVTNQGEIDYFDPDTKYPQNFRAALGADRRLPWGLVATADVIYTREVNGWYVTDENLSNVGTSAEGRALYGTFGMTGFAATPTRIDPANLRQAVKVRNEGGANVWSASAQVAKSIDRYDFTVGYAYSRSYDLMSLTSSQALSNFQFAPIDGSIQDRNARPGAFDRTHKISINGAVQLPYGFNVGLNYIGQSGTPYTYTVNGDVNADGINGNDLAFIPADPSQISLANDMMGNNHYDDLQAFIASQPCLAAARGGIVQRGACRNPWQNFLNLRLAWGWPVYKTNRIDVQFDIFNVMNLLNSDWGLVNQVAAFETGPAFLRATGYDMANNRPIYTFTQPAVVESTSFSPTLSRWRMQLGARYSF